jgi:hypothetical protein
VTRAPRHRHMQRHPTGRRARGATTMKRSLVIGIRAGRSRDGESGDVQRRVRGRVPLVDPLLRLTIMAAIEHVLDDLLFDGHPEARQ